MEVLVIIKLNGFTLLELLMVIVTIAVLAAVLIPNVLISRRRALDAQTQSCLKELSTGQAVHHIVHQTYAVQTTDLADYPEATCRNVEIVTVTADAMTFEYTASHINSEKTFSIGAGSGVNAVP